MKKIFLVTAITVTLGATSVVADERERDPVKDAIAARQAAFTLMAANIGPMGAMMKGMKPFDKEEFARRAANLEALGAMPWEFFIPGSDKGHTEAKPEVWSKAEDYKAKADDFQKEAAALVQAVQGGDEKAIAEQFGKTAKSCKACHKEFKEKDKH
jgi:cytochrome c556